MDSNPISGKISWYLKKAGGLHTQLKITEEELDLFVSGLLPYLDVEKNMAKTLIVEEIKVKLSFYC